MFVKFINYLNKCVAFSKHKDKLFVERPHKKYSLVSGTIQTRNISTFHSYSSEVIYLIRSILFDTHCTVVEKWRKCDITFDLFTTKLPKIIPFNFLCKTSVKKPVSVEFKCLPSMRSFQILFKSVALFIRSISLKIIHRNSKRLKLCFTLIQILMKRLQCILHMTQLCCLGIF